MQCITCQAKTQNPKFCSSSCAAKYNNSKHPKRKLEGSCGFCKRSISSSKKYCSVVCKKNNENKQPLTCQSCLNVFPRCSDNFYKRHGESGKFLSYCKACYNKKTVERQRDNKKKLVEMMGGKCVICSYFTYIGSMHFHHVDPTKKEYSVGSCKVFNIEKAKAELDKCVLVCSNCHGEIHAGLHPKYLIVKDLYVK